MGSPTLGSEGNVGYIADLYIGTYKGTSRLRYISEGYLGCIADLYICEGHLGYICEAGLDGWVRLRI